MSIVSSIRDYVEFLNTLSDSLGPQGFSPDGNDALGSGIEFTSSKFISETCFYFLKTLQYSVYYIFSFQWLRDFTLLPVTIPQISYAIFSENFFLESPSKNFFEFLEIPCLDQNKFLLGFFNSFFLTLPITVTHIIGLRRLIIQGIPAAFFSFLGFILGQTLFILFVTFGIRTILIPWLSLEPFNYILGLILIFQMIYSMVGENLVLLNWDVKDNQKFFIELFLINFLLAWCEQSCIFQYFSNITLTGHPSILEGFSTKTTLASFFSHSNYIFGIFLGSILFSLLWAFFILQIKNLIVSVTGISLASFVQTVNKGSFIVVLGFTLSSIPFYGLEYLVTGPLGFISQDNLFKNTIFDQNQIKDPLVGVFNAQGDERLNFEVSSFDRGRYLVFPEGNDPYTFEDLNYRGEMDWITRTEKLNNISDSKASFLSITKIFKKQKDQPSKNVDFHSVESNIYGDSNSIVPEGEIFQDEDFSPVGSRFRDWYNYRESDVSDANTETRQIKENFKNFNLFSFSTDFLRKDSRLEPNIEKKIKQKYYSNPIYKNLLAVDIDLFLNRQPKSSFLGAEHELDLYEKRQILNSYYDSLRLYTKLPYSENFEIFFNGTKSFTNKVYNQQFKGTLKSIRRLFSLSKSSTDLISTKTNVLDSVLKYDQPLYQSKFKFSPYHEEIPEIEFFDQNTGNSSRPLGADALASGTSETNSNPFLTEFISNPLYAGWDENLRKFVITTKLLPRAYAGYEMNIPQEWYTKFNFEKQLSDKPKSSKINLNISQKINFTVWPKPKEFFVFNQPEVPFRFLFEYIEENKSLPSNYKIVKNFIEESKPEKESKPESLFVNLAPQRGGFIWPGTFPFDFKNIFK